jgi:serine protease Do
MPTNLPRPRDLLRRALLRHAPLWRVLLLFAVAAPWQASAADAPAVAIDLRAPKDVADVKALEAKIRKTLDKVLPSVVAVSGGSGVVVGKEGYVLSVAHVGEHAGREVGILFPDGRRARGKTLGNDEGVDAGLMKLDGRGPWPSAEMGKSRDLKPGQWCLAVGYPVTFDRGKPAVVRVGRILRNSPTMVITDCPIMGGDSGGPLFDLEGRVIGIGSRCDNSLTENVSVPVDAFLDHWDWLVKGEDFDSRSPLVARLGVAAATSGDTAKIARVLPGTPAEKAGLKAGDVIVKFAGKVVASRDELSPLLRRQTSDEEVAIEVRRGEKSVTLKTALPQRAPSSWDRGGRTRRARENEKNDVGVKAAFRTAAARAAEATVRISSAGKPAALGTVVDSDGLIVSKASLLGGELKCRLPDGRELPAKLLGADEEYDLALLKVEADKLNPVVWRSGTPPAGSLLIAAGPDGQTLAVGAVSTEPRKIGGVARPARQRGWLGIELGGGDAGLGIRGVTAGSAAEKAGAKRGDRIKTIDGAAMKSMDQIVETIGRRKPADVVKLVVVRDDKDVALSATLAKSPPEMSPLDHWGGGPFSERRGRFPLAIPHDTIVGPGDCGGPLLDADGNAVGVNVARALRVTNYAIPAASVQRIVTTLKAKQEPPKGKQP